MKKLLATTALCLVFSTGITSAAQTNTIVSEIDVSQIVSVNTAHQLYLPAISLYQGDFQQIAKPVLQHALYTGAGSALMTSLRNVTD